MLWGHSAYVFAGGKKMDAAGLAQVSFGRARTSFVAAMISCSGARAVVRATHSSQTA